MYFNIYMFADIQVRLQISVHKRRPPGMSVLRTRPGKNSPAGGGGPAAIRTKFLPALNPWQPDEV